MDRISQLLFLLLFASIGASDTYICCFVYQKGKIANKDKQTLSSRDMCVCALTRMESESCQLFSFTVQQNLCPLHPKQAFCSAETADGWRIWMKPSDINTSKLSGHPMINTLTTANPWNMTSFKKELEELDEHDSNIEPMYNSAEASLQYSGNITLHQACKEGKLDVVKYILAKNSTDINSWGKLNRTPVMVAARNGHLDIFDFLVSKGCNLSLVNENKDNVFHFACGGGNTEIVRKLLTGIFDIDVRGRNGKTGLICAVKYGNREVVDLLESKGCDMKTVDVYGSNALHYACLGGHVDMVKYILSKQIVSIDSRGHYSKTPVMMAGEMGHMKVVALLVHRGCSLTALADNKCNILHLACICGDVKMVRYLLSQGKVSFESRGQKRNTPVMTAAEKGQIEVVKFLVRKGCSLTGINVYSDTILHLAAESGNVDLVEYILSRKVVDINSRGYRGCTAVMAAAEQGHRGVVDLLVRRGCNLSIIGKEQNTVLHSACMGGNKDIVKDILKQKVRYLKIRNKYGRTPLQVAKYNKHQAIVDLLNDWKENLEPVS